MLPFPAGPRYEKRPPSYHAEPNRRDRRGGQQSKKSLFLHQSSWIRFVLRADCEKCSPRTVGPGPEPVGLLVAVSNFITGASSRKFSGPSPPVEASLRLSHPVFQLLLLYFFSPSSSFYRCKQYLEPSIGGHRDTPWTRPVPTYGSPPPPGRCSTAARSRES